MSGNFPDILFIKPEDQNIKIEQIRDLNRLLGFKPVEGRFRASIIHQAETMTEEAANSDFECYRAIRSITNNRVQMPESPFPTYIHPSHSRLD